MGGKLFEPITFGGLTLPNRIVISPMCQYSSVEGSATDWHLIHLGHLALSGAGLMILEATAAEADGRISFADAGLYSDDNEKALARVLEATRRHSPIPIGIQMGHAGRKASMRQPWVGGGQLKIGEGGWQTWSASPVPFLPEHVTPVPLDRDGMARVRAAFRQMAERVRRLGLDMVEIHAAHGYLLHQFLSPLSNQRTDDYGGSLENRMRFPLEVFDTVREALPDMAVAVRVSATDWVEGGWDLEQTVQFCQALKDRGCDAIDASSGGVSAAQQIPLSDGYQVPFAERIKAETGLPTIAVGLITRPAQAEEILQEGKADMICLARAMLYDPRWPWHAAAELGAQVTAPPQYLRCQPRGLKDLFG